MNVLLTVGPSGPAPPATATSLPAATETSEAAPFAAVLQQATPSGSAARRAAGDPVGPQPGALDLAALIQQLLGGEPPTGGQTATELESQLGRTAGAGLNETSDTGGPVDGAMLVALMTQPVIPAAETSVGATAAPPLVAGVAVPVADALLAADVRALTPAVGAASVAVPRATNGEDAPRVILPDALADAPRAEVVPVTVPEGDQQQPLPFAQTEPSAAIAEPVELSETADVEITPADVAVDEIVPGPKQIEPVRSESQPAAVREIAAPVTADAAPVGSASPPQTSTVRSTTPITAMEPSAAASTAPAFTTDLAGTVQRASMLGEQEVRLLLNPPDLGHLDIRIVESPRGLRVVLEATTAEARELIEQQLPALRNALEARDLRVERLEVEQSLETSSMREDSERGLPQDGRDGAGAGDPDQDAAPWSPVAALRSDQPAQPAVVGGGGATGSESGTRTVASNGRLNVLA